jgi:hypothetical protein
MKTLIDRLKQRILDYEHPTDTIRSVEPKVFPPVTLETIQRVEEHLGFRLPDILRNIYLKVGNGGFGPGYGLIGVREGASDDQGNTMEILYHLYHKDDPSDPNWHWPKGLVPICYWGCAIYSCIDCIQPAAPVIVFDPNVHEEHKSWDTSFILQRASLEEWIEAWLNGSELHLPDSQIKSSLNQRLKQLLNENKMLSAIITYQKESGCSLQEAKKYIEALAAHKQ